MTWEQLMQQWWLHLSVTVAGGLILAGILAIFSRTVRQRFWRPIGHALRWPFTLRVTTKKRLLARGEETSAAIEDAHRISGNAAEAINKLNRELESAERQLAAANDACRAEVEAVRALGDQEIDRLKAAHRIQTEEGTKAALAQGHAQGLAEGKAEVEARIASERAAMVLRPTWRIVYLEDDRYMLNNTQSGVEVSDVSIAAPLGDFQFVGDTQWPGAFDRNARGFRGQRMRNGKTFGVKFDIRYRDANGDWWPGEAWIDKEPRRAVVL